MAARLTHSEPATGGPEPRGIGGSIRAENGTRSVETGGVLVEFALVALVLYLLVAGAITLGRGMLMAQQAQDVARVMARELALVPLPPELTFEQALAQPEVLSTIYDPDALVVDLDAVAAAGMTLDEHFATLPIVNRALRPVMIFDQVELDGGPTRRLLRAPGALLRSPRDPNALTVGVPLVTARDDRGVETIRWLDVVEEVRADPDDPSTGSFSLLSAPGTPSPAAAAARGVVAVRVNLPLQSSALSSYRGSSEGQFEPNGGLINQADDATVQVELGSVAPGGEFATVRSTAAEVSPYEGRYGLGRQFAFGREVRPFRRVLTGQALFRREAFRTP